MRWLRILGALLVVLAAIGFLTVADDLRHVGELLGVGGVLVAGLALLAFGRWRSHEAPRGTLVTLVDDLVEVWNRGDAAAFAALFTENADYVTGSGRWLQGREAIAGLLHGGGPPPRVELEGTISVHDLGDLGSVVFRWRADAAGIAPRRGLVTCVAIRSDGRWRVDRLHNTDTI